ncbi:UvrD-helicase domain-containing protein [Acidicapsa acidisoli]|uniref:UvrD-helicase domain-containing protein n=1 Tax=Acidicapsa acidisoli TaxID=1615681 RepID=UPI0021E0CF6A|nr:UvrD-helicase domain-containing protein [Acidicapsa acidisoli]
MINIPPLTPELLDELGNELGGCTFTGEDQKAFLSSNQSCDVQAAPGNGKTTLLVAKLALLSRCWTSRSQGVSVISHTNTAREEVEKKLFTHPAASSFLAYPHFIGTVTAFIDRFIALPYLRGLGWSVQRIDDDVFASVAGSRWKSKPTLTNISRANKGKNAHSVTAWVCGMDLASDFVCAVDARPTRLAIRDKGNRQPGPHTKSGAELEELKAEIGNDGFYRFADMTAIALQAIDKCPTLLDRVRRRFPLVLLDEAQDTNGAQLELLDRLFSQGVAYQKLGDQNQTLYEDAALSPNQYWRAGHTVISLNQTRRFGGEIAAFASRLTVRSTQQIEGLAGIPCRRSLILFDRASIARVLPVYASEVRAHWGQSLGSKHKIWAVASRHNPSKDTTGDWPKTLMDYCPHYRSSKGRTSRHDTLCGPLREMSLLSERSSPLPEIVDLFTTGVVDLLRHQGILDPAGNRIGKRNLWTVLASRDRQLPLRLRRLMRDRILFGNAAWCADGWKQFCRDLNAILGISQPLTTLAVSFLAFVPESAAEQGTQTPQRSRAVFVHDDIPVQLGSIHSVKGKTVDSILVLETEVWRGQARDMRAMDVGTVLPHVLGIEDRDFNGSVAHLAAATNIFVAATRARQLLALALRKEAVSQIHLEAAHNQGWQILDTTEVVLNRAATPPPMA